MQLLLFSTLLAIVPFTQSSNPNHYACTASQEFLKLKYDQLEIFEYYEGCDYANDDSQNALLGSGTNLNCGPDGNPRIEITDWKYASTSYIKKFCMNVHGADRVEIEFYALEGPDPPTHVEDLSDKTGWYRFCLETRTDFEAWMWDVDIIPKNDGSEVKVKNVKLAVCRFFTRDIDDYYYY